VIETELKLALDAEGMARLRRHPALARMRLAPRRRERLVSIYYDTPSNALADAGVSLRLRRIGRDWVQTVKRKGDAAAVAGLFAQRETEFSAPGGRLRLDGPDPDGALAAVVEAAGDAPLSPVFETRVDRVTERLRAADGGEVELALDQGEIRAGTHRSPILEAELELKAGEIGSVYKVARELIGAGPVRFAASNKSDRGYRLAATGSDAPGPRVRNAGTVPIAGDTTLEMAARDILRDCLAQVADNVAVVLAGDAMEGPHQLRVGLRRLRTALKIFGPALGSPAVRPLSQAARDLGRLVGSLRDADVLADEVVGAALARGADQPAATALTAALAAKRKRIREKVRAGLGKPAVTGFLFDLATFIEARGWLVPADFGQTARLATPIAELAPEMLRKRAAKVRKRGRKIRSHDHEALHALRKELKKLRYAVDMLGPIYKEARVEGYLRQLKDLQDTFGSLNDAAMAAEELLGPGAPAKDDPDVQRGIGWVLGTLAARVEQDRPKLFERWERLEKATPFWS
jgi:inorganic triphosphatase YgiF